MKESQNKASEESNTHTTKSYPIDAPYYSAGSMVVQGTGNYFVLTFSRPIPG